MEDDEFLQIELNTGSALREFKRACDQAGHDFDDRLEDLIYSAKNDWFFISRNIN